MDLLLRCKYICTYTLIYIFHIHFSLCTQFYFKICAHIPFQMLLSARFRDERIVDVLMHAIIHVLGFSEALYDRSVH